MTAAADPPSREAGWIDAVRTLLDRPLTTYYLILGSAGLLVALGLVMVLSASSVTAYSTTGSSFTYFQKQALWVGIGLPVALAAIRLPVRAWRWLGYPLLVAAMGLMALLLVPHFAVTVNGATRWIRLGPLQIQPSEPAKLALVLWGADLLARKEKIIHRWRHLLVPLLPVAGLCVALVMVGSDLGTTVVFLVIILALLWVAGAPARLFGLLTLGVVGAGSALIWIEPYRLQRVTTFLHPHADRIGASWQPIQGLYALGSGGWFGLGLGASRQKWGLVPNQYTDYIFSIIGEELGLIGTLVVVLLFLTLAYAGIQVARRSADRFVQLAAGAVTAWLLGQAIVNMGAVVGLLPITGIPLPMVSFGVSALVPTMVAVAMLASFARQEPAAAAALAARRDDRRWRRRPAKADERAVTSRTATASAPSASRPFRRAGTHAPRRGGPRRTPPARKR
jgi:cell division protein FtsW